MSVIVEKAKILVTNHNTLNNQLEILREKVRAEEKVIRAETIELVNRMNKDEFAELFDYMEEDSTLKFTLFIQFKDKMGEIG